MRVPIATHSHKHLIWSICGGHCPYCFSLSNSCVMTSHYGFNFHFPNDQWNWASFHMSICYLYIFSGGMSVQIYCPLVFIHLYLFLFLTFESSLYVLEICPFCKYFSHYSLSFHFLNSIFSRAKVFQLEKCNLLYFFFDCFWCCIGEFAAQLKLQRFPSMLSSQSFILWNFIFGLFFCTWFKIKVKIFWGGGANACPVF